MPKANKIKGRTPDKNRHIIQWRIWDGGGGGGVRWVRMHCPPNIMCPFLMKLKFKNQL